MFLLTKLQTLPNVSIDFLIKHPLPILVSSSLSHLAPPHYTQVRFQALWSEIRTHSWGRSHRSTREACVAVLLGGCVDGGGELVANNSTSWSLWEIGRQLHCLPSSIFPSPSWCLSRPLNSTPTASQLLNRPGSSRRAPSHRRSAILAGRRLCSQPPWKTS